MNATNNIEFLFKGIQVKNPSVDQDGKSVIPELYYAEAYINCFIKTKEAFFNEMLKKYDLSVSIFETSESYTDVDEDDDEYYNAPMFEAYIVDIDEEEIDDTTTGRYCSLESVCDELEGFVHDQVVYHSVHIRYALFEKTNHGNELICVDVLPITQKQIDNGDEEDFLSNYMKENLDSAELYIYLQADAVEEEAENILLTINNSKDFDTLYFVDESILSDSFDNDSQLGMLETYGADLEQLRKICKESINTVWTVFDKGNALYVKAGFSNDATYYIITTNKWRFDKEEYLLYKCED